MYNVRLSDKMTLSSRVHCTKHGSRGTGHASPQLLRFTRWVLPGEALFPPARSGCVIIIVIVTI